MNLVLTPLPIDQLREKARAFGVENVDFASYHSLRWHDPAFTAVWKRYNAASPAWQRVWSANRTVIERYEPDPTRLVDPHEISVCEEYIAAKAAYNAILDHFLKEN